MKHILNTGLEACFYVSGKRSKVSSLWQTSRRIWEDKVSLHSFLTSVLLYSSGKLRLRRYLTL